TPGVFLMKVGALWSEAPGGRGAQRIDLRLKSGQRGVGAYRESIDFFVAALVPARSAGRRVRHRHSAELSSQRDHERQRFARLHGLFSSRYLWSASRTRNVETRRSSAASKFTSLRLRATSKASFAFCA